MNSVRALNSFYIIVLSIVLVSGFVLQTVRDESPCLLCFLQRFAMIAIGIFIACNLRFGIKKEHYLLSILAASFGMVVSLWQIHVNLSLSLLSIFYGIKHVIPYVWTFFIFIIAMIASSVLLFFYRDQESSPMPMTALGYVSVFSLFLMAFMNVSQLMMGG